MAKKQAVLNPPSAAGAAPARAVKAATPRTRAGKHSKATVAVEKPVETPVSVLEIEELILPPVPEQASIATPAPVAAEEPREAIARLAYSYWEARGFQGGDPLEDWVRAEEEYRRLSA